MLMAFVYKDTYRYMITYSQAIMAFHDFFNPRKRALEIETNESNENPSKLQKHDNSVAKRKFNDSWKSEFPFISYDAKTKSMFCDYCVKSQFKNAFTSGCNVMKKESLTKHVKTKGMFVCGNCLV